MSATAEPCLTPRTPPRLRPSLVQPLHNLRSRIRRYVVVESLALLVIAVAGWAVVSLILDWGIFYQLFGFDYLRDAGPAVHTVVRGGLFLLLLATIGWIAVRYLFLRLARPLSESDLSLLLERRFGKELGDRLVTAVELSDAEEARRQGYSWTMVEATMDEAEGRLGSLRVADVLNRPLLVKRVTVAALCLLTLGTGMIVATEVVGTWAERNVFFANTPWPRDVVLELVDFPTRTKAVPFGSELKVTVRSARWAVSDPAVSEGWRPLRWSDLTGAHPAAWELEGVGGVDAILAALPADWRQWNLDQVEARLQDSTGAVDRPLGLALIRRVQEYFWEHREDGSPLPPELAGFLPENLRQLPVGEQKTALAAAAALSRQDAERVAAGLTQLRPALGDAVLSLATLGPFSTGHPLPCLAALQKFAYERDRELAAFAMPENERLLLPAKWLQLPVRDLAKRLRCFADQESAESLGRSVAGRVHEFFATLGERASWSRLGTRKTFRRLTVPDKITLEFENVADGEERTRGRAKRGQPELKRAAFSNEYQYDFKKVERALRLRASAGSLATPWHRVEVRPLPALSRLARFHDEPGYLHGSLSRVVLGPLLLPLDGEESRASAPLGSRVWFEGESQKPLRAVRTVADNPADAPSVEHAKGATRFVLRPRPNLADDLRFKLEIEDEDGIKAVRTVALVLTPDKPPEFVKAQFEAINRKFITPKAILPLSVFVKDDNGLLGLGYEVVAQKGEKAVDVRLPFRQYSPLEIYQHQPGGLRFEQPEHLTIGRLSAQLAGEAGVSPYHAASLAGRIPSHWMSFFPGLTVGLRREYAHDYVDRNLYGPVLNVDDEFLDTRLLGAAANRPADQPLFDPPYRLVVRLAARDNRMREDAGPGVPAHQVGQSNEAFEFNVVTEQDVLIETGRREEDLRDRFEETIAALRKVRNGLKRVRDELDVTTPLKEEDVRRAANDAADATKALAVIRNGLDEKVLREFRQIFREMALNRVDDRILDRVDVKICQPLAILLQPGQSFGKLEEVVDLLARRLDAEQARTPKTVLNEPVVQADRVLITLDQILQDMRKLIEFNEALRVLRDLIGNEQKLIDEMKKLIEKKIKDDLNDQ